jgi:hypothetical protein
MAVSQMEEVMSHRCIPDESSTEEECLLTKINHIHQQVADWTRERDELSVRYPVFQARA